MKITFVDGSFMLSWDRIRAWYNPDGALKDAEYKWPHRAVAERHTKVRAWLEKQGREEVRMPYHAADVERAQRDFEQRMQR